MAVRELGAGEREALLGTLRGAWPGLPALLAASVTVCAGATVTALLSPGITPVSVLLAAVLVGPGTAALTRAADGGATVRQWWCALRELWLYGMVNCLIAAAPAAALLVALTMWRQSDADWLLLSVGLNGAAALLALLALAVALPLGVLRPDLRGRLLWACGLHLVLRHPLRHLAGPSLAVLGVWASVHWSASLLLLTPGPAMVVTVAAVRLAAADPSEEADDGGRA
ncbi:hypothetical protein DSC45_20570 [Streptomyces sp. YIM 130001]|uniref:hypothetical protein n=1 Tax=Streptomyces sp. YIM 130001 TaxID=2259644 RepID=UPI000E64E72D|nr:hypothetical protein [Streptomyces sp. YIM 130001]RII14751.1 hypothetical protein DSC45_20570 [Streptomyces sp. YIM 130001]